MTTLTLGHYAIVYGAAVFTAALDTTGNPTSLSATQTTHLRDLT